MRLSLQRGEPHPAETTGKKRDKTMANTMEYKCPCCGGVVEFDSHIQQMKCPYCDTVFNVEDLKDKDDVLDEEAPDETQWDQPDGTWEDGETDNMNVYTCKSCGGEIIADETTGATQCPYCGNPVVLTGRFSGDLKPDVVIPFKLDKAAAKDALKRHMSKKKLLPKLFSEENHIDEIKGVYVPFWLYEAEAFADLHYTGTKVRCWSDGRNNYTETSYYDIMRSGVLSFDNVPADGSSKMPDDLMDSLEPYDFSEAVEFRTAYLSGYIADRYDVSSDDCAERVNKRMRATTESEFRSTVSGYSSVSSNGGSVNFNNTKVTYALLPVWMLTSTYEGKQYTFAMNGQSGKFVGDLPMDKGKYWLWHLIYTVIFAAVGLGICLLASALSPMWIVICIIGGFLLALIPMGILKGQIRNVHIQKSAVQYARKGSLVLYGQADSFRYSNVTAVPIPRSNNDNK